MHSRFVRPLLGLSAGLLLTLLAAPRADAQDRTQPRPPAQPRPSEQPRNPEQSRTPPRASARPGISNDQPSYRREFTYGINFNTRAGLIGGVTVRSTRLLSQDWARFWSLEAVEIKHPKEEKGGTVYGGTVVAGKSNSFFAIRPSVGLQRVIFRKAPDAGVQVNGLLSGGPSIGLLMPYYISYNYSPAPDPRNAPTDIRNEQYDPLKHNLGLIIDRAPLFTGAGETKPIIGAHLRGALSFEYGRYRDAVAGVEVGALLEAYAQTPVIIRTNNREDSAINNKFLPSVYLIIYLGSRN